MRIIKQIFFCILLAVLFLPSKSYAVSPTWMPAFGSNGGGVFYYKSNFFTDWLFNSYYGRRNNDGILPPFGQIHFTEVNYYENGIPHSDIHEEHVVFGIDVNTGVEYPRFYYYGNERILHDENGREIRLRWAYNPGSRIGGERLYFTEDQFRAFVQGIATSGRQINGNTIGNTIILQNNYINIRDEDQNINNQNRRNAFYAMAILIAAWNHAQGINCDRIPILLPH